MGMSSFTRRKLERAKESGKREYNRNIKMGAYNFRKTVVRTLYNVVRAGGKERNR